MELRKYRFYDLTKKDYFKAYTRGYITELFYLNPGWKPTYEELIERLERDGVLTYRDEDVHAGFLEALHELCKIKTVGSANIVELRLVQKRG